MEISILESHLTRMLMYFCVCTCISSSTQAGSVSIVSNEGTLRETGLNIDSKNKVMNHVESFLTTWGTADFNQKVYV